MESPSGQHDNSLINNHREGTRVILREITATLQNSPPPKTPTKNKAGIDVNRTSEHEIKVKFAREFIEITDDQSTNINKKINDNNSLSSASSIQSLTSTLSTKSSSGICIDSPSRSFDTSYANSDIPGLDDLLSACAGIRLEDSYADSSFASANDQSNIDITQNNNLNNTQNNFNNENNNDSCIINNTDDIFSKNYDKTRESLSRTLTDVDIDESKNNKTVDFIQSLTNTSVDNCLTTNNSEHTFSSSSIDFNKTKDTIKEEIIINPVENNIEFNNSNSAINETINVSNNEDNLSILKTDESSKITVTETNVIDDNNFVDQAIQGTKTLSISNNIDNQDNIITDDKIEESNVENSNVISTLNQTVELSQSIEKDIDQKDDIDLNKIEENDDKLNTVTNLNETIELPHSLVIEKNINNQDNINSCQIEESIEQSNVVSSLNNTFEVSEQQVEIKKDDDKLNNVVNLNNTIEVSQPVKNISDDDIIPSEILIKSDESNVTLKTSSFDKLKSEIFEALAAEKLSDDVVSIKDEINSPLFNDNNQDLSQQQNQQTNTTLTLDDTINCTIKNSSIKKEQISFESDKINEDIVVNLTDEKDKSSSINCTSNVIFNDDDFDKLKLEAQRVADDLYNTSIECNDKEEEFVLASTDLFIDPMSVDLSSLNTNKTKNNTDNTAINRLRAESLYVKFDPLVSNTTMLPQGNISTSQKNDTTINGDNNDTCIINSELNSPKRNPAIDAIDRLLIYSPIQTSNIIKKNEEQEKIILPKEKTPEPITIIDTTMAKELELVRTNVLQLEEQIEQQKIKYNNDLKLINDDKEKLELQNTTLRDTINQLKKELQQEIKNKNQVTVIIDEYRKTIERLNIEKEKDKNNFDNIKTNLYEELQDAKNHLTATEAAFNDVHAKYEKLKIIVNESRNNEKVLKESIDENIETIKLLENRYEQIKSHAAARLEKANQDLDTIKKQHESDNVRIRAMLRKEELKSKSLAELVEQKTKENKELTQILDEVISRVGQKSDD